MPRLASHIPKGKATERDALRLAEKRIESAAQALDLAGGDARLDMARVLLGEAYEHVFSVMRDRREAA